ncbi:hypothetical protein TIFTF001_001569 [Ficus carica]|uniref:Uncharacterized protein n=1 Tax=Ficus carica TaxID=3494 RepID=A0AA88D4Z7_FICCA|nr:hypothetical protein TIFTF001_001569 [Ficus carica]
MAHPVFTELNSDLRLVALFCGTSLCDNSRDGIPQVTTPSLDGTLADQLVAALDDLLEVTKGMMEALWKSVQVRYKLQKDWEKAYVFKVMANLWRASKSRPERILDKKIKKRPSRVAIWTKAHTKKNGELGNNIHVLGKMTVILEVVEAEGFGPHLTRW